MHQPALLKMERKQALGLIMTYVSLYKQTIPKKSREQRERVLLSCWANNLIAFHWCKLGVHIVFSVQLYIYFGQTFYKFVKRYTRLVRLYIIVYNNCFTIIHNKSLLPLLYISELSEVEATKLS